MFVAALVGAVHLVPDSRDPHATRLDPVGAVLSIAAIGSLVYAIIQAPERGWTSTASLVNFAVGTAIGIVFVAWEMRRDDPMLDIGLFRNRSFSAGSIALTLLFFAMAGTVFLQAQYLQFILDYTPLAAGFALVPAAIGMLLGTGAGAHLAAMHGGRITVTTGTLIATAGVAVQAALVTGGSYLPTGVGLLLFGLGAGIAMPAATEMIMASLPPARAGVGSAVNDTVREFGGALGVAVIGSVAATSYATSMRSELDRFPNLTSTDRTMLTNNVGAAIHASRRLGAQGDQIASVARSAFVHSMNSSLWIAAGLAFGAALVAYTQLPRHTTHGAGAHGEPAHHHGHATSRNHRGGVVSTDVSCRTAEGSFPLGGKDPSAVGMSGSRGGDDLLLNLQVGRQRSQGPRPGRVDVCRRTAVEHSPDRRSGLCHAMSVCRPRHGGSRSREIGLFNLGDATFHGGCVAVENDATPVEYIRAVCCALEDLPHMLFDEQDSALILGRRSPHGIQ